MSDARARLRQLAVGAGGAEASAASAEEDRLAERRHLLQLAVAKPAPAPNHHWEKRSWELCNHARASKRAKKQDPPGHVIFSGREETFIIPQASQ